MPDFEGRRRRAGQPHQKNRCSRCRGSGRAPCTICNGRGQVLSHTDVNGHPQFKQCSGCYGVKTLRCSACSGEGFR